MKKITMWLFLLMATFSLQAQSVANYSFSQNEGTYTELTGGTILGVVTGFSGADSYDSELWAISDGSIPFNFNFNGIDYTGCSLNSNGFITFGTTTSQEYTSSPISGILGYDGAISAWGKDTNGAFLTSVIAGETSYEVVGTAPNREFVIQFKNWRPAYSSSVASVPFMNFQIRLVETSNVVKIVYGSNGYAIGSTSVSSTVQIGLRGASSADYNNRTNVSSVAFASSSAGTSNSATQAFNTTVATPGMPANGLTYLWTPPVPCTGAPVAGTVAPATQTLLAGNAPVTLTSTGLTSAGDLVLQWQESADGITGWANATGGSGATTSNYTPPTFAGTAIYYRLQITCTPSGLSAVSNVVSLNPCSALSAPTAVENFTTYLPSCWTEAKGELTASGTLVGTTSKWIGTNTFANAAPNAAAKINAYGGTVSSPSNDWLISSVIDLGATPNLYRVKYKMAVTNYSGTNFVPNLNTHQLRVVVSTDGGATWSAANVIKTYTGAASYSNIGTDEAILLTGYTGEIKIGFLVTTITTAADLDIHIDDFVVEEIPSCLAPNALTVSNVTANSATLTWNATTATDFQYVVQTAGTGIPAAAGTDVTGANSVNSTGLTASTSYEVYVRSNCSASNDGFSTWTGPINFTTNCEATNVPYMLDFEAATVPNLPICTSQENLGTGNLWTVVSAPVGSGNTTKALRYLYNYSNPGNVWFYTQGINLVAGTTYTVAFDYGGNSTTYVEKLKVAYGLSANASDMTNAVVDLSSITSDTPANSATQITPTVTGVYYFGFNAYSAANQNSLVVDNISIDLALSTNTFVNSSFSAYPNPVRDVLNVSYDKEISNVTIINLLGQVVLTKKVNATQSTVNMSQLNAGVYMVNIEIEGTVKTLKVIKE